LFKQMYVLKKKKNNTITTSLKYIQWDSNRKATLMINLVIPFTNFIYFLIYLKLKFLLVVLNIVF
jgi:hypothetical protein